MKNILLIEDDRLFHDLLRQELKDSDYNIESAYTLEEAEDKIKNLKDYDVILIDGCVPGDKLNTLPIIDKIKKKGYDKPIVAISSYKEYRDTMLKNGCNYESNKKDLATFIKNKLS